MNALRAPKSKRHRLVTYLPHSAGKHPCGSSNDPKMGARVWSTGPEMNPKQVPKQGLFLGPKTGPKRVPKIIRFWGPKLGPFLGPKTGPNFLIILQNLATLFGTKNWPLCWGPKSGTQCLGPKNGISLCQNLDLFLGCGMNHQEDHR